MWSELRVPRCEVLLHGQHLTLLDENGAQREGGVYVWRAVDAEDENSAISKAKESLLRDPMFLDELWASSTEELTFEVDEIRERPDGAPSKETSPVFYIEEAE